MPLAEGTGVTILGAMSYNYVEGGTGSAGGNDDENTVMMNDAFTEAGLDVNADAWTWLEEQCGGYLVQIGGLGLSTVLVSMVGASTGLSYYNLLYVCFISSIVYTVLVAVPGVKKWIFHALPQPVRRALPAAAGLLMAWIAIQLTGIFTVNGSDVSVYGAGEALEAVNDSVSLFGIIPFSTYSYSTDKYHPLLLVCAVCVLVTFVFWLIFRQRTKRPFLYALLCGTLVFFVGYLLGVCVNFKTMKFTISSLWGVSTWLAARMR